MAWLPSTPAFTGDALKELLSIRASLTAVEGDGRSGNGVFKPIPAPPRSSRRQQLQHQQEQLGARQDARVWRRQGEQAATAGPHGVPATTTASQGQLLHRRDARKSDPMPVLTDVTPGSRARSARGGDPTLSTLPLPKRSSMTTSSSTGSLTHAAGTVQLPAPRRPLESDRDSASHALFLVRQSRRVVVGSLGVSAKSVP